VGCPLLGDDLYAPLADEALRQVGGGRPPRPQLRQGHVQGGPGGGLTGGRSPAGRPASAGGVHLAEGRGCRLDLPACASAARLPACLLAQALLSGDPGGGLAGAACGASGARLLQEAAGAIGLQAWRLEAWGVAMGPAPGESGVFEAGAPWWRA
jgi:hypothetical protein